VKNRYRLFLVLILVVFIVGLIITAVNALFSDDETTGAPGASPRRHEPFDVVFTEDEINSLVRDSLTDQTNISDVVVDLKPGYAEVKFTASIFGRRASGSADVHASHDEHDVSLSLQNVTLAGIAVPGSTVTDANHAIAKRATPQLNEQLAQRAGCSFTIQTLTISDTALVITVLPQ
jgi:predicted ribosomally synthesized peptide with SipW-like signal peptide